LPPSCQKPARQLLIQGEIPKSVLLETHHQRLEEGQPSVIFGLDSFSEGLDLPGESCVHVIIAKLPFAMPDDPVGKTLSRWIEKRGGNPFVELTVPEASIKLIQAVGRLIRTERDYGRVTILDNRLVKQSYGKKLLASLPPFKRI
jgi:ATP-dependent DNA helicase DinG